MMRQPFYCSNLVKVYLVSIFTSLVICTAYAAPESLSLSWQALYDQGVEFYREGDYSKALKYFRQITQEVPESQESHYYYAITLAQLGRFKDAREAYENVIKLAPETEAAKLAQMGLEALPQPQQLDAPPQFYKNQNGESSVSNAPQVEAIPEQPTAQQQTNPAFDSQAMQMMMMLGSMGGKGGINPMMMMPFMQQGMTSRQNPSQQDSTPMIPPSALSTMMMNQLLQDFSFDSKSDD